MPYPAGVLCRAGAIHSQVTPHEPLPLLSELPAAAHTAAQAVRAGAAAHTAVQAVRAGAAAHTAVQAARAEAAVLTVVQAPAAVRHIAAGR